MTSPKPIKKVNHKPMKSLSDTDFMAVTPPKKRLQVTTAPCGKVDPVGCTSQVMEINSVIGCRLQYLRRGNKYTQTQLAKRLGISHAAVSDMERGKTDITISRIYKLAPILSLTPGELINFLIREPEFDWSENE